MQVTLSETAWHMRLQKWVMGGELRQSNLCPYFWMTILCMGLSPILVLGKIINPLMEKMNNIMNSIFMRLGIFEGWTIDQSCWGDQPLTANQVGMLSEGSIYRLYEIACNSEYFIRAASSKWLYSMSGFEKTAVHIINIWKGLHPDWESLIVEIASRVLAAKKESLHKQEQSMLRWNRAAGLTKQFAKIITILVIIPLSTYMFYQAVWMHTALFFSVVAMALFMTSFIMLLAFTSMYFEESGAFVRANNYLARTRVCGLIKRAAVASMVPFELFIMYGKAIYSKSCPGIVWADENNN